MALNPTSCSKCSRNRNILFCSGCSQSFCTVHVQEHQQELNRLLAGAEDELNLFKSEFNERTNDLKSNELFHEIDRWEEKSIQTIRQSAENIRQELLKKLNQSINVLSTKFGELKQQISYWGKIDDFNEIDIKNFHEKLLQLKQSLDHPTNLKIESNSAPFIDEISLSESFQLPSTNIERSSKWKQNGQIVAAGNGKGDQTNQLHWPYGLSVSDDQTMFIADCWNDRIIEWRYGETNGRVVAGGNGKGDKLDQLNGPTDLLIDKLTNSFIICDMGNRRVVRWSRQTNRIEQIFITNVKCSGLTMDKNRSLYIVDESNNQVIKYNMKGNVRKTVVAGGNGQGIRLNQFSSPSYVFVDDEYSIYVSDYGNHRVMKWKKDAKEGTIVAGGQGRGQNLWQLSNPEGILVDNIGNIYISDCGNNRIMRWSKDSRQGEIVIDQQGGLSSPAELSFDQKGNLFVVDNGNHRVLKYEMIDTEEEK